MILTATSEVRVVGSMSGDQRTSTRLRRKVSVPHRMTVRFGPEMRAMLDALADDAGITYEDGRPRDAELVRVMLVSAIYADQPAPVRLAVALYSNSVLALSGLLALTVADLRDSIGRMTQRMADARRRAEVVKDETYNRPVGGVDRARVFLVLDDLLHRALVEYVKAKEPSGRAPASAAVREMLQLVVSQLDDHIDVIRSYGRTVSRVRSAIRQAVEVEKDRLAEALRAGAA